MTAEHKKIDANDRMAAEVEQAFDKIFEESPVGQAKLAKKGDSIYMLMKGSYLAGYVGGLEKSSSTLEEVNKMLTDLNGKIADATKQ